MLLFFYVFFELWIYIVVCTLRVKNHFRARVSSRETYAYANILDMRGSQPHKIEMSIGDLSTTGVLFRRIMQTSWPSELQPR